LRVRFVVFIEFKLVLVGDIYDCCCNYVSFGILVEFGYALDGFVVGFGGATRENDLLRVCVDQLGNVLFKKCYI
jgi:hypothetical protein